MTDLVAQLVGLLEEARNQARHPDYDWPLCLLHEIDAALSAAKDGGWVAVQDCPDGDVWFALSCGHVVMGYKRGDLILDWEAAVDHDCCYDASAIKAMPVVLPNPPKEQNT